MSFYMVYPGHSIPYLFWILSECVLYSSNCARCRNYGEICATVIKIHKTKRLPRISSQNERGLKEF